MLISGYAIRYGVPYQQGGPDRPTRWTEIVQPGAADLTVRYDDVALDVHHDGPPLASTRNGSLWLVSDTVGVWFAAELDRGWAEFGVDVAAIEQQVADGKLSKSSWQGNATVKRWQDWSGHDADPLTAPVCRILVLALASVCLTDTPANLATSAKVAAPSKESTRGARPSPCPAELAVVEYGDIRRGDNSHRIADIRARYATATMPERAAMSAELERLVKVRDRCAGSPNRSRQPAARPASRPAGHPGGAQHPPITQTEKEPPMTDDQTEPAPTDALTPEQRAEVEKIAREAAEAAEAAVEAAFAQVMALVAEAEADRG